MMGEQERVDALRRMQVAVGRFYGEAVRIGNHPFIEFAGLMTAYVNSCRLAHGQGVDFTECNVHAGRVLPMESFEIAYVAEKLDCIFGGRIAAIQEEDVCLSGSVSSVNTSAAGAGAKGEPLEVRIVGPGGRLVRIVGLGAEQARAMADRIGGKVSLVVVGHKHAEQVPGSGGAA